jgi:hypothetical protein
MKHLSKLLAGILFMAGNFVVQGQFRAPGGLPAGFHHALLDTLTGGPAFYGTANIRVPNGADNDPTTISCSIAYLSGNLRVEANSFDSGTNVPPLEATQIQQMHSVNILRPDKNRMYVLIPRFTSMVELAYNKGTGTDPAPAPKIIKSLLGTETVGDQSCQKSQWQVTESDGEQYDITVWESPNWNNFPIQLKIGSPGTLVQFQDLHLEPPNGSLFEVPPGYTKYEGIQEIIQRKAEKPENTNAP